MKQQKTIKPPIFICGMMGTGKSTIGRILAKKAGLPFYDLDTLIEVKAGKSIPDIFADSGEEAFRELEKSLLIERAQTCDGIMALGGGSLQNQHLTDHVKLYGWLIYVDTAVNEIVTRLHKNSGRPMINKTAPEDLETRITNLLEQRSPFYEQAHITVQTAGKNAAGMAKEILNKLWIYNA